MKNNSLLRSTELCDELFNTMTSIQKTLETRRARMQAHSVKLLSKKGRLLASKRAKQDQNDDWFTAPELNLAK